MPVTGKTTTLLFCEGKKESLDYKVLSKLRPASAQVVPAGGKYGLRAFAEGRISALPEKPRIVVFRDRDFDKYPTASAELLDLYGDGKVWLTYRSCIESYLLTPEMLADFWRAHSTLEGWSLGSVPGSDELECWLHESAARIENYQAVRWALASLQPEGGWPVVKTKWLERSGILPSDLDFGACLREAELLVKNYLKATVCVDVDGLRLDANKHLDKFREAGFLKSRGYEIWFHGKDMFTSFAKLVHEKRGNSLPLKSYVEWAAERFDLSAHPDLIGLRTLIS